MESKFKVLILILKDMLLRQLNGMKILVNGIEREINVIMTADLKSLDLSMGRQIGRPKSLSIHTTATLDDCSPAGHKGEPFSWETQPHIKWKSIQDYNVNNANVTKEHLETGEQFKNIGIKHENVTGGLTFPVTDIMNVFPGIFHIRNGIERNLRNILNREERYYKMIREYENKVYCTK